MRALLVVILLAIGSQGCRRTDDVDKLPATEAAASEEMRDPDFGAIIPQKEEDAKISLVRLLADPDRYDNRWIQTVGYLTLEFEGSALYLSKDDRENMFHLNSVWVSVADGVLDSDWKDGYAIIDGVFYKDLHGHFGIWQSGMVVTRIRPALWFLQNQSEPNQAPDPPTGSVTPPADARDRAPANSGSS